MKHARIAALLALASINLKSPLFGNEKFVELKESQLDKIEAALVAAEAAANNTALEQLMAELKANNEKLLAEKTALTVEKEALAAQVTALTAETESLKTELNNRPAHSLPANDGKEEEVKGEFFQWVDNRKFAPTIKALKTKLESLKNAEMDFHRKKISDFNEEQAELISNRIIQKITTQFVNHLKDTSSIDESITWLQEVFQLEVSA